MNIAIHPKWFAEAEIACACGNVFTVGSTKPSLRIEICSRCHPFFTGELRYADTKKRVQKYQDRAAKAKDDWSPVGIAAIKTKNKTGESEDNSPRTLKEMLMALQKQ